MGDLGPMTPLGIRLQRGQSWRERDNRFKRYVVVTDWDSVTGRVQLNGRRWARLSRFNGKSHGYYPEAPTAGVL